MKLIVLLMQLVAASGWAHDHPAVDQTTDGYKQFDGLRAVLGHWGGTAREGDHGGQPYQLWTKLISGGSSLMETEKFGDEPEMITVYFLDQDKLVMTHYCSANNQPHMVALPAGKDGKRFEFAYDSATNLPDPKIAHMTHLVMTLQDADHLNQKWTWTDDGKDVIHEFRLTRIADAPKPAAATK